MCKLVSGTIDPASPLALFLKFCPSYFAFEGILSQESDSTVLYTDWPERAARKAGDLTQSVGDGCFHKQAKNCSSWI